MAGKIITRVRQRQSEASARRKLTALQATRAAYWEDHWQQLMLYQQQASPLAEPAQKRPWWRFW